MSAPKRIRLSRAKGFDLQAASKALNGLPAVNVARPSAWGNPFVVGEDGTRAECVHLFKCLCSGHIAISTRATVEAQRAFLTHAGEQLATIRGRNLACWCPPDTACHADVLLDIANRPRSEP